MKIYMVTVTLQIGMAAQTVELAHTIEADAEYQHGFLTAAMEKPEGKPVTFKGKGRKASFIDRDIRCVMLSEMTVQGGHVPMFQ